MAIALRSTSTLASGTRTNSTVTAPTGATTGDVITIALECGGSSLATPVQPGGWTQIAAIVFADTDPWSVSLQIWVKAYAGESNWTFTHASRSSQAFAIAWTGVDTTTPVDVTATSNVRTIPPGGTPTTTADAPSITPVTAGARLLIARGSWDGNAIAPPAGWTEQYDAPVLWVGHKDSPTAVASGVVAVPTGNGSTALPWGVIMGALRPASGGGAITGSIAANTPTVTVAVPTSAWNGTAAVPVFAGLVAASTPTVTVSVPTSAWTGTTGAPTFTGTLDASTPAVSVDVPSSAWTGTTTVPQFTGTLTASTPTVSIAVPSPAWTGTVSAPGAITGTIVATTPGVTVSVPTSAWSGTVAPPSGVTGTLTASTPTVTIAVPTSSWSGTYTPGVVPDFPNPLTLVGVYSPLELTATGPTHTLTGKQTLLTLEGAS